MRKIQVYIEGVMLDLFKDEQIQVNSTIQNIADISKVYTDFSQSFTVPATENNNKIFSHFYNSDVKYYNPNNVSSFTTVFNVNTRKDARIEINLTPFRTGKIQLEKANIKNGKPESYSITFYGDVTALKDKFGEDMLSDLDISSITHTYNGTQVYNRIIDHATDYDIRYPLISSERNWNYGGSPSSNDITSSTGRIVWSELFPAIKVSKIFDIIESQYGVTFTGNFLNEDRFKKLFLWAKNNKTFQFATTEQVINFTSVSQPSGTPTYSAIDLTNDKITYSELLNTSGGCGYGQVFTPFYFYIDVTMNVSDITLNYYIDVYRNGAYSHTVQGIGNNTYNAIQDINTAGLNEEIQLKIRAQNSMTVQALVKSYWYAPGNASPAYPASCFEKEMSIITCASQALAGTVDLATLFPEMKVADFFSGILQMFNLTCYGTATDTYDLQTIETWYSLGEIHDITTYTDIESIEVNRVPLYNKIAFKYQESESVLNKAFKGLFFRNYGDLEHTFPNNEGGEFTIELPFENIMGEKFTGTTTQVAYALDENLSAYTPKPCLLYMYDNQATSLKFYDGSAEQNITNYVPFGQDLLINSVQNLSLNWGQETSTFTLQPVPESLYLEYYESYLGNLYQLRNRLISVKTQLPISLLTSLELNDRLVIRDKRYIINEMKSNLTNGEVNFTLLRDFREVRPFAVINVTPAAGCVNVPVNLLNGVCSATIATTTAGVTITPSTITSSQIVVVCFPANSNTQELLVTEDAADHINTEDYFRLETEESAQQSITLTVTQTYCNGNTTTNTIIIQQP